MLNRVLEPEVMDDPSEAAAYDAMNHDGVNSLFVSDIYHSIFPKTLDGPILDLGSGNGLIPLLVQKAFSNCAVVALDAARSMLAIAQKHVAKFPPNQIGLVQARVQRLPYGDGVFKLVISNSLVHHLPEPWAAFVEAWRVVAPGGWIFLRDLARPETNGDLEGLVKTYAAGESDTAQRLFAESLHAALTVVEVRDLVTRLGAKPESVFASSDRHWTWFLQKPASQGK